MAHAIKPPKAPTASTGAAAQIRMPEAMPPPTIEPIPARPEVIPAALSEPPTKGTAATLAEAPSVEAAINRLSASPASSAGAALTSAMPPMAVPPPKNLWSGRNGEFSRIDTMFAEHAKPLWDPCNNEHRKVDVDAKGNEMGVGNLPQAHDLSVMDMTSRDLGGSGLRVDDICSDGSWLRHLGKGASGTAMPVGQPIYVNATTRARGGKRPRNMQQRRVWPTVGVYKLNY
ncbi:hypothetical protein DFH09DRAFT_1083952 [Mycena vulgaris]|nr:hypothetical protein DFH09DRAFT_1083952 [Mycena vulgaris]